MTLIEVVIGVTLLGILVGGIFGIINAGMRAVSTMDTIQERSQEMMTAQELVRQGLRELPAQVTIEGYSPDRSSTKFPQIVMRKATGVLEWGTNPVFEADVVITAWEQPGGLRTLAVYHLEPAEIPNEPVDVSLAVKRLDLFPDLRDLAVRYYFQQRDEWLEDWVSANQRPSLIELSILPDEQLAPMRMVFWLPPVIPRAAVNFGPGAGSGGDGEQETGEGDGDNAQVEES